MTHSIEVWRAIVMLGDERTVLLMPAGEADLPMGEEGDDAIVEVSRTYPALSREIAAYLAR